jgi:hypothetical protein
MNNTTADFLATGDMASIEYSDVHGLWGGHVVRVLRTGEVLVKWVSPATEATERQFQLSDDEVRALFDLCVEHDLCTVTLALTQLVVPDSTTYSVTLSNGREHHLLDVFAYQASDPRVAPILGALRSLTVNSQG